jgi:hypothetical protein
MADSTDGLALQDPSYRRGIVDLLGVLSYGELTAFDRLAEDAKLAPNTRDKARLASMAAEELRHFEALAARLAELDVDVDEAMSPFRPAVDRFHEKTTPADWLEGLVKAYVGDGLANDFYREIAAFVDADTRNLILATLADAGHSAFVVDRVRAGIEADHRVAGRLALWGRRLMGEALSQAQAVVAERDSLSDLISGSLDRPGMDLAAIGRMLTRLTDNHTERMSALGLSA